MKSIIVEGIDRIGKDLLIKGVMNRLGYFKTLHYQKPELLDVLVYEAQTSLGRTDINQTIKRKAFEAYQIDSFKSMFEILATKPRFIINRGHLGETVYAPRYRSYDGSYVFNLEGQAGDNSDVLDNTLLVLLHASDTSFLVDDGESFDFEAKDSEQIDFMIAFKKSKIKHKLLIDVSLDGGFVPSQLILNFVASSYSELEKAKYPAWQIKWSKDINGNLKQELTPLSNDE